jgi:hypothetical protein
MGDLEKVRRAVVLGCALLEPGSDHDDHLAYVDAMAQLDDLTNESILVLIAMRLMQGAPHQMTNGDPERIKRQWRWRCIWAARGSRKARALVHRHVP